MSTVLARFHEFFFLTPFFFSATVNSMQGKIEGLSTTNALMKEDLSICQNALFKSQEENKKLLSQMGGGSSNDHYQISTDKVFIQIKNYKSEDDFIFFLFVIFRT